MARAKGNNLPIIYENVMLGFDTEIGRDAFLWATEQPGNDRMCYRAEAFAREAARIAKTLRPWAEKAMTGHDGTDEDVDDLIAYVLTRHANWRYGGDVKPGYAAATVIGQMEHGGGLE